MQKAYFITGTDTDAGKTWTTVALMHAFEKRGLSVIGMKPVASGCRLEDGKLKNEDALLLQQHASIRADYDLINPYAYALPISPHLAGRDNPADLALILSRFHHLKSMADIVLVEGAGGWHSPVNDSLDISGLARALGLPVIMTVAIRLGCINHARLTARAVRSDGLELAGWAAVSSTPNATYVPETIDAISQSFDSPLIGTLPYCEQSDFNWLSGFLDLNALLSQ